VSWRAADEIGVRGYLRKMRTSARALLAAAVLSLLLAPPADARRVSLWIEPVDQSNNNAGSRLAEHVRVSLPNRGKVRIAWPGAVWTSGDCRIAIGAQARERRRGARFTISDPYAQRPFVRVSVDVNQHCPDGSRQRILRSAALDQHRAACAHDGAVVAQNPVLRVYDQPPFRKVCALASHRRFDLGFTRNNNRCYVESCYVGETKLVGRLVAYASEYAGRRDSTSYIHVRDGLSGREVLQLQSGPNCDETNQAGPVSSLVLRADGAVAWIVQSCTRYPVQSYEVRTSKGMIAAGTDIDPDSLLLTADGITWTQAGVAHTATLEPGARGVATARS
jgi:hypothetical protein